MDLNKVMLIGRLTRDPELRTTPNGQSVTSFGLATNLVWVDKDGQKQEKVEFHNIVAWRKLAEICSQYLHRGSRCYIEGRLQTRDWTGQDGVKRYRTEVIADNMIILDSQRSGQTGQPTPPPPTPPAESTDSANNSSANKNAETEEEVKVEDIPF